jgi:molybdopterin-guanine dinucleotide biosynthesis protein A
MSGSHAAPSLHGLVLAGGRSRRMRTDKALIDYHGRPQLAWTYDLVATLCEHTWVSVRADQRDEPARSSFPQIEDVPGLEGPAAGIRAAQAHTPEAAWLVVACDLPFLDRRALAHLVAVRDPAMRATAYVSTFDGLPEPLCAIWEPSSAAPLAAMIASGRNCPRKALMGMDTRLVEQLDATSLENANTPEDRERMLARMSGGAGDGRVEGR